MSEFYKKEIINQEQRAAPRYAINLKSSVLITAIRNSADDKKSYLVLQGHLRDVSMTGLALIISYDDMRELEMFGDDLIMHLLLPLPVEAIELEAAPVRYQRLDESEKGKVLVGAQITNMKGRDRILFMDFIREGEVLQNPTGA
jgi:hypothetical protein